MTLSISDQPSQWRRLSDHPSRLSLLSDATIDPFPHRVTRSTSLLEHHIVRDSSIDLLPRPDDGRRSTLPFLPVRPSSVGHSNLRPQPDPTYHQVDYDGLPDLNRKRDFSDMAEHPSGSSSPASVGQNDGQTQFCLCQPEPKIPRPRNAFILYRQHHQAAVVRSHPGLPNPAISKIIGEQWSHLPEQEKDKWKALAEEEKARHAQQYPEYRYQPRRNGRYSSQSSGTAILPGGKVDENGNCVKCGGKTMNPPNTSYTVYPTTPTTAGLTQPSQAKSLTYAQAHRPSQQVVVSPPRSGVQAHGERGMWVQQPHRDPRFDPRPRYRSEQVDGPDLKRRRFDSGYVPTREYREVPPPYPYSPREAQYSHQPHHDMRSGMVAVPGPPPGRVLYQQAPPLPPKLQPIRPPPPQQKRDPNLTLPPLTTPAAQTSSGPLSAAQGQNSGLEAMIMSIPVLNKVKILSQISPQLANPSVASPPRQVRGAIIAVEGLDPGSVWSMTNSLADELTRDGKFCVKIFSGPDPFTSLRGDGGKDGSGKNELGISDCLRIIGQWHKISEEMKKFIITRPAVEVDGDEQEDVDMTSSISMSEPQRNSVAMTDPPGATTQTETPSEAEAQKTPTRAHRPTRLNLNPPEKSTTSKPSSTEEAASSTTTPPTSGKSTISPKTMVTNETANLTITTPPPPKAFKNPWSRGDALENPDSPPYTRIPSTAQRVGINIAQETAYNNAMDVDDSTNPKDGPKGKAKECYKDTHVHFDDNTNSTKTTSTRPNTSVSTPAASSSTAQPQPDSIPIALVPHYQLSTVDASAITMPIVDCYSPLAHWQWLATLWRGCVGPDVSVVIKNASPTTTHEAVGAGNTGTTGPSSGGEVAGEGPSPANGALGDAGPGRQRQGSLAVGSSSAPNSTSTTMSSSVAIGSAIATSASGNAGQGVEVRLLDCRAVVVRTNIPSSHAHAHQALKSSTTAGATIDTGQGEESTITVGNVGGVASVSVSGTEETMKRNKEDAEFWEKAKRRVGFEVAEFLRR